eukprot:gene19587-23173_t
MRISKKSCCCVSPTLVNDNSSRFARKARQPGCGYPENREKERDDDDYDDDDYDDDDTTCVRGFFPGIGSHRNALFRFLDSLLLFHSLRQHQLMTHKFSYWLSGKLYLNVTNRLVCKSPIALRGPSFQMPNSSGFAPLRDGFEPSAEEIFHEVDSLVSAGKVNVDSMRADPVTFAGDGEPLLRLNTICDAAGLIKESRHGLPLRLRTSGLVRGSDVED